MKKRSNLKVTIAHWLIEPFLSDGVVMEYCLNLSPFACQVERKSEIFQCRKFRREVLTYLELILQRERERERERERISSKRVLLWINSKVRNGFTMIKQAGAKRLAEDLFSTLISLTLIFRELILSKHRANLICQTIIISYYRERPRAIQRLFSHAIKYHTLGIFLF